MVTYSDNRPLTEKQLAFCREFVATGNATKACVAAGYSGSDRTATARASAMLKIPKVAREIGLLKTRSEIAVFQETRITKQRVVEMALEGLAGAKEDRKWDAYRGHVELLAKLHGYIIDKKTVRVIRSIEDLSGDELRVIAGEILDAEEIDDATELEGGDGRGPH